MPVCTTHKKARHLVVWSGAMLIDKLAAGRAYQRFIEDLRGKPPATPKLVR